MIYEKKYKGYTIKLYTEKDVAVHDKYKHYNFWAICFNEDGEEIYSSGFLDTYSADRIMKRAIREEISETKSLRKQLKALKRRNYLASL